ncbi:MAG: RIP metalloprotease RseP [Candidatus Paceibacterota bacterium]|jgi:regulator of sigma E protease
MSILIFIIILLVLVLVHEFGHFFTAKKFGIRVDEFGFGFPPKLFGKKFGETEYTVNLLPLGGFVRIFGETPDEESVNGPDALRSFINKARWKQAIVLVAGVFMNFLLAWLLFSLAFISGRPTSVRQGELAGYELQDVNLVIVSIVADSPAAEAGLKPGDKILAIGKGEEIVSEVTPVALQSFVAKSEGKEIFVNYQRGDSAETVQARILPKVQNGTPIIGIAMDEVGTAKMGFFKSFAEGFTLTRLVTQETAMGLYKLIKDGLTGAGSLESITGPVGLVGVVGDAYQFGFAYLISFAALISINLGIINLLPFPALDGGRLLFLLIEKIKGSRMNLKMVNAANSIGFIILILLMLLVTYNDIAKILS